MQPLQTVDKASQKTELLVSANVKCKNPGTWPRF